MTALRQEALSYYDRKPFGDEQEGASPIVTSEFADVVESLMPGLMRVFTAADDLAFSPGAGRGEMGEGGEPLRAPRPDAPERRLPRPLGLLKDALMFRLSGVTVDLEDIEDKHTVPVEGLTHDAVDLIMAEAAGKAPSSSWTSR